MPPIKKTTVVLQCMALLNQWANESSDSTWRAALKYGAWRLGEEYKCQPIQKVTKLDGKSSSNSATTKTQTSGEKSKPTRSRSKSGKGKASNSPSSRKSTVTRGKKKEK